MFRMTSFAAVILSAGVVAAACSSGGGGDRRVIPITQTDGGCEPGTINVKAGEKVRFAVTNNGGKDKEVEGTEGTKLGEVLVPSGKTRNLDYTAPKSAGTDKIKCYVPGGDTTVIEVSITA